MRKKFTPLVLFVFSIIAVTKSYAQVPLPPDTANAVPASGNNVFEKVEVEASVDRQAWRRHLESNLLMYIEDAVRRGMKAGTYTVNVRFLVEKDGRITDVKALNDPGYGLALGAVRTVRTGPLWQAGELQGKKVRSYHTQPITFVIQEK